MEAPGKVAGGRRTVWLTLLALGALGALFVALELDQPIVRNSLVYARAAEHVLEHGMDPRPVVADSALSYDKPVGFAWLAAPLVGVFGPSVGLVLASWLGTLLFLVATARFVRVFDPFGLAPRERALVLVLVALGPLVVYQFWSAHPDGLFAAIVLWAWALLHEISARAEADARGKIARLGLAIVLGLVVKNYALILFASAILGVLFRLRAFLATPTGRQNLVWLVAMLLLAGGFAYLGWIEKNPLVRLAGEGGGVGQYGRGEFLVAARGTLLQVGLALALQFHVALFLVTRTRRAAFSLAPALIAFPLAYVVGLLPFPTSYYNMRYLLPLFPFVALLAVAGARGLGRGARGALATVHATLALALVLAFNTTAGFERVAPHLPDWRYAGYGNQDLLDNLRMPQHRAVARELEHLNASVPPGAVLYLVNVFYYRDAQQGVYERSGLLDARIETRYVSTRDFHPGEPVFFVSSAFDITRSFDPEALTPLGTVADLGQGLYRVERRT